MGQNKNAAPDFSFQARWGDPVVDGGIAPIPMVFLSNYAKLGISPNEGMAIIHAFSYKWTADDPFPSMGTLAGLMGKSRRQVIRYFNDLEERGFLIKTERYAEDGRQLSCILNFKPLLDACMEAAQEEESKVIHTAKGEDDTPVIGGDDTGVTGGMTPLSHEPEAGEPKAYEEKAVPDPPLATKHRGELQSLRDLLGSVSVESASVSSKTDVQHPEDSRPVVMKTLVDLIQWSQAAGYRNIDAEISRYGVARVIELAVIVERLWRQREIRDRARYLNWMIHSRRG